MMTMLATIGTIAIAHAELFCWKIDPARMNYCMEEVVECIMDEGVQNEDFCMNDYIEIEGIE